MRTNLIEERIVGFMWNSFLGKVSLVLFFLAAKQTWPVAQLL